MESNFLEKYPDTWQGKDAKVKNWQKYFWGGPYSWRNSEDWQEYYCQPRITGSRAHDEYADCHPGYLDYEWGVDFDAMAYQLMHDPDPRMTYALADFMEEYDEDYEYFQSYCELMDGDSSSFVKDLRPTCDWMVREMLVRARVTLAHTHPETPPSQRIVKYLENAIHALSEDPETVFEVNGYSGSFERPLHALWHLWLLWDYATGGDGDYKSLPWRDEGGYPEYYLTRRWENVPFYGDDGQTLGYVLKVCNDAIARTIEGNNKKNAQIRAEAKARQEKRGLYTKGSHTIFGQSPWEHDHAPFHTHYASIYLFEADGQQWAVFKEYETPEGHMPVFAWDSESDDGPYAYIHPHMTLSCPGCDMYWDYEHGQFVNESARYNSDYYILEKMPWLGMWELIEMQEVRGEESERLDPIPVSPGQKRMFGDHMLYENELKWRERSSSEFDDIVWLEGVIVVDDDDNIYCPHCHAKMQFSVEAGFDE